MEIRLKYGSSYVTLPSNSITELTQEANLFLGESFYIGSTVCRSFKLGVDKNSLSSLPDNSVLIYEGSTKYADLVIDNIDDEDVRSYKFTLTDRMVRLNEQDSSWFTSGRTIQQLLSAICTQYGIAGVDTIAAYGNLAITWYDNWTARDFVSWVAELLGGYAYISDNNYLKFSTYSNTPVQTIPVANCDSFKLGEQITIDRVVYDTPGKTVKYPSDYSGTGCTLYLNTENALFTDSGNVTIENQVEYIYNVINGFSFYNVKVGKCPINGSIRAGQCIAFTLNNVTYKTIAQVNWNYNSMWLGGYELELDSPVQAETQIINSAKKTFAIVQRIDREVGEISSTVSSVETKVDSSINHISYLYGYGDSATQQPGDGAFTYSNMPPLVSSKYIWRMSLAYTNENPTSNPTKTYEMIQGAQGEQGEPGQGEPGADGYNSATIYLYKRAASTPSKPAATSYTFSTHSLSSVPSGWSITVPSGTNPLYVSTVSVSSQSDTVSIASSAWSTPQIMASNGTNGTNGTNGISYYTHIRYSANSDGSSMTSSPQANTKYIGVYTGTSSTAPTTASSYTWSKYVGDSIAITSIQYAASSSGVFPAPTSGWQSSPPTVAAGNYLWTKVNYSSGDPSYSVSYQGKNGTNGTNGTDGDDGVSVTGIDNLYYLKNARLDIVPNGNTTQGANPSPSSPQAIHSVKGDNEIRVVGFNLFDKSTMLKGYYISDNDGNQQWDGGSNSTNYIQVTPSQKYYIKSEATSGKWGAWYDINKIYISGIVGVNTIFTAPSNAHFMRMTVSRPTTGNPDTFCINVSDTEKNGTYEPYKAQVYPINLPIENLFNKADGENNKNFNASGELVSGTHFISNYISVLPNTTYYLSNVVSAYNGRSAFAYDSNKATPRVIIFSDTRGTSGTFTTGSAEVYVRVCTDTPDICQLEKGSKANSYTPYGISPIELNALGNYKDYFYKSDGKWYLHKAIDKVDMGTLSWGVGASSDSSKRTMQSTGIASLVKTPSSSGVVADILCTGYAVYKLDTVYNLTVGISLAPSGNIRIYDEEYNTTATGFASARKGVMLYYALATPTETEITDETLISQLDNLALAISYDGGTNLVQTNSDNPFILTYNADALTRPSKPVAEVTTSSNLPEVWSLQPATFINGYRYYNSLQVHYDNNTLTWTDVVEDSSMTYVSQQVSSMNTDIVQNAEAIALKADRSTVDTSISSLNNRVGKVESDSAELQVTASGISETVSSIQSNLNDNYLTTEETKAEIKKSADSISETFSQTVTDEINGVTNTVSTMIRRSGTGIDIGVEGTDNSFVSHFDNDSLDFNNTSTDTTVAWVDASDGLGGKELSVGDYKQQSNRWRIFTRQNGSHLTFTRHS